MRVCMCILRSWGNLSQAQWLVKLRIIIRTKNESANNVIVQTHLEVRNVGRNAILFGITFTTWTIVISSLCRTFVVFLPIHLSIHASIHRLDEPKSVMQKRLNSLPLKVQPKEYIYIYIRCISMKSLRMTPMAAVLDSRIITSQFRNQ